VLKFRPPPKKTFEKVIDDIAQSTRKHLRDGHDRVSNNKMIVRYYKRYAKEQKDPVLINKAHNVQNCFKYITSDTYEMQKVKNVTKCTLCHDYKFCANCLKMIQDARINKYMPMLRDKQKYLYHMTITNPNCSEEMLKRDVAKMSECFTHLIEILSCKTKIKDVDFKQYNFLGCIRSLEVTYKSNPKHSECYHPHYHCAICFDLDDESVIDNKHIKNVYSRDKKNPDKITLFSDFEVLIQKLWYLIWHGISVTKKNIESQKLGYSCKVDRFKNKDAVEIFKYMTKVTDEKDRMMKYEHFKALYTALYRKKQIQAYKCFYKPADGDVSKNDIKAVADEVYQQILDYLNEIERPKQQVDLISDLLEDARQYKIISRRKLLKRHLKVLE